MGEQQNIIKFLLIKNEIYSSFENLEGLGKKVWKVITYESLKGLKINGEIKS